MYRSMLVLTVACSLLPIGCNRAASTAQPVTHAAKAVRVRLRVPRIAATTIPGAPSPSAVLPAATPGWIAPGEAPTAAGSVVPLLPPNAPPRIVAVNISSTTVHAGQKLSGDVITTSNVASVEVRVAAFGTSLEKTGVGRFALIYKFGGVPFFLRGTYTMRIIARNTRGDAVERTLPLTVR